MAGGLGNDVYTIDNAGDSVTELAGQGSDEVRTALASFSLAALANIENLTGTSGAGQTLTGNGSSNIIAAGGGNDVIDGGAGADAMAGGLGNDIYTVDNGADAVTELAGQGTDEVRTALAAYALAAEVETLTGTTNLGQALTGNGLANLITAGWGNDVIDGGLGADDMRGSLGNDVYLVDNAGDTVTEGDQQGLDEVRTNLASYSLAGVAYVENLTGGAADQSLTGNGFNNVIDGGAGADSMAGGGGHDVYIVDNLGDTVTEVAGAGIDEVRTGLGSKAPPERAVYVLPNFIENLTGTSATGQGVRDNALGNLITMGAGHDLIAADAGGVDTINGGAGNDFIYYGNKLTAADITNGGLGVDTIALLGDYSNGITFTAASLVGVERMALFTSLYLPGPGLNHYVITMHDVNVAAGAEFFVTAASLQMNEILVFYGDAETDGRFTIHGGQGHDVLNGGLGGDFFLGNGGDDRLYGLGGTDFLIGGLGADLLHGGAGADRFVYQSIVQSRNDTIDRILDFEHVDRIDLTAIDANGNAADGNSAFTFIGSNAFGDVAGELRAYQSGGDWFVEGDLNGDGHADLTIQVTLPDATPLGAGDFFL
jgi:Ca2+-binding RTX toxin-like protein